MRELRSSLGVLWTTVAGGDPTVGSLLKQNLLLKLLLLAGLRRNVKAGVVVVKLELLILGDEDLAGALLEDLLMLLLRGGVRRRLVYNFVVRGVVVNIVASDGPDGITRWW